MRNLVGFFLGSLLLLGLATLLLPLALLWCLVLLLADLLGSLRRRPDAATTQARDASAASIMILNWDGRGFLEKLLPSLRAAVGHDGGDHEIILVDNGSQDDSVAYVRRQFPEVKVLCHDRNLGFVAGYNEALAAASRDILILLNNDMVVGRDFLPPLLSGFAAAEVFAVTSQIHFDDESKPRLETGLTSGYVSAGLLKLRHDPVPESPAELLPTLWGGGGSTAFDRRRLLELGGLDPIYDPFYYEDTGLCFEAWKRGWSVLFAKGSRIWHEHQGTSSKRYSPRYVARIRRRNSYLFLWRHLTDLRHTLSTTLLLPFNLLRQALRDSRERGVTLLTQTIQESWALASTVPRLPRTLLERELSRRRSRRSDREVFALASQRQGLELGESK